MSLFCISNMELWFGPSHRRIYIPAVQLEKDVKPDYLATIDVDPNSPTYSQVWLSAWNSQGGSIE